MNLLLDKNLSPRLVQRLASLFPGLIHVRDISLKQASDEEIWNWARENGYTAVTTIVARGKTLVEASDFRVAPFHS